MSRRATEPQAVTVDRALLSRLAEAALRALERERQRIDGLNVHPVPDGDTGRNLFETVGALAGELEAANEERLDPRWLARTLPMGARGTSGVILSQIVRGLVEAAPADGPVNARALAAMLARAKVAAYGAVQKPVEGTMLTIVSELARASRKRRRSKLALVELLDALAERGEEALGKTPEQLDVLRESGVVDAGGAGLMVCLRAVARELSGEDAGEVRPALRLVPESVAR